MVKEPALIWICTERETCGGIWHEKPTETHAKDYESWIDCPGDVVEYIIAPTSAIRGVVMWKPGDDTGPPMLFIDCPESLIPGLSS